MCQNAYIFQQYAIYDLYVCEFPLVKGTATGSHCQPCLGSSLQEIQ